jgi:myo-inositol-1(or 4)-monophosphatase
MGEGSPDLEAADALDIARAVAGEAAALLRGASENVGVVRTKSNLRDLVTEWDTRSEELITRRLGELSPGVALLAEEGGASGDASGRYRWLIDPIDGTVNFAHGLPVFTVTVALERDGQPIAGVVHAPALGWELYGHEGGGSFHNGERMQVSQVTVLQSAMLASGFPYDRATNPNNNFAQWEHFQRRAGACRRMGAASLDLAMVARGWFDGYWETRLNPWDLSAGALLVREAGGRVTSIDGGTFVSASGNAVASNGAIHKEILDELAVVGRISGDDT